MLKTSLNAYSFNRELMAPVEGQDKGFTLFDLLDYCAEQGFDAIDATGYYFPGYPNVPDDSYVNDLKRKAFRLGLNISGTGVRNDFTTPDRDKRAADVRHIKEWVEVAARLGAPVLRIFSGKAPEAHTWDQVAEWMVEELQKCAEHGRKYGVIIGIQNHWDFLKTSDQVLEIIRRVDSDWCGVVVDTGSFRASDPYQEIEAAAPHAVNWQVKEYADGREFQVRLDLKKIVQIANRAGYHGYLPIETLHRDTPGYDPRTRAAELLGELRAAIREAE